LTSEQERASRAPEKIGLGSIKNRILLLAVVATLIPSLGTAVLSYRQNRAALAENLQGELLSRGSQAAREVDLWTKERSYDVRVFTGSFEVSENLDRIRGGGAAAATARARLTDYLEGVHGRFTDFADLVVRDPEGAVEAASGTPAQELRPDWLERLEQGETVLGEPYWDQTRSRVAFTVAAPIGTADGRFLGVLAATPVFDAVQATLAGLAPEAGRIDLVAADGSLIASSAGNPTAGLAPAAPAGVLERLGAGAEGGAGTAAEYVDRSGVAVVGTATPLPVLGWTVLTQVPTDLAYAQVVQLRNSSLLLVFVLLVLVGGLAYLLGTVIVRPLGRLAAGASAVAAGDLSVDLPVTDSGEVGSLTRVFNDMVDQLRGSRAELQQRNNELERLSVTDLLTGLYNRRYLLAAFEKEIQRTDRNGRPFCVLMLDVDRFKQLNDTYGHLAGDKVLAGVGKVITEATRDVDIASRYGGEEFLVLLPECDLEQGIVAAERVRARLAEEKFEGGSVTMSIGVAEFPMHGETTAAVIAAADTALYDAKHSGRDQVKSATPQPEMETKKRATKGAAARKR
jgi:diguanylate cyclase (GGDEF)-like protein